MEILTIALIQTEKIIPEMEVKGSMCLNFVWSIQGTVKFRNTELAYMEPILSQICKQLYRIELHKVSKAALVYIEDKSQGSYT